MSPDMQELDRRLSALAKPQQVDDVPDPSDVWLRGRRRRRGAQLGASVASLVLVAAVALAVGPSARPPAIDPAPSAPSPSASPTGDPSPSASSTSDPSTTATPLVDAIPGRGDVGAFLAVPECAQPDTGLEEWARNAAAPFTQLNGAATPIRGDRLVDVIPVPREHLPDQACRSHVTIDQATAWSLTLDGELVARMVAVPSDTAAVPDRITEAVPGDYQQVTLASGQSFSGWVQDGQLEAACCDNRILIGAFDRSLVDLDPGNLSMSTLDDSGPASSMAASLLPSDAPEGWTRCSAWYSIPFGNSRGQAVDLCDGDGIAVRVIAVAVDQAPAIPDDAQPLETTSGAVASGWTEDGLARLQMDVANALPLGVVRVEAVDPTVPMDVLADVVSSAPALDPALANPRGGDNDLREQVDQDWIRDRVARLDASRVHIEPFEGITLMVPGDDGTSSPSPVPLPPGTRSWRLEFTAEGHAWAGSISFGPDDPSHGPDPYASTVIPLDPPGIDMIATAPDSNVRRVTMSCGQVQFHVNSNEGPNNPPSIEHATFLELAARLVQDLDC